MLPLMQAGGAFPCLGTGGGAGLGDGLLLAAVLEAEDFLRARASLRAFFASSLCSSSSSRSDESESSRTPFALDMSATPACSKSSSGSRCATYLRGEDEASALRAAARASSTGC